MFDAFNRFVFVLKTRWRVARFNYDVEHSFVEPRIPDKKPVAALAAVVILVIVGAMVGKNLLVSDSTASIQPAKPPTVEAIATPRPEVNDPATPDTETPGGTDVTIGPEPDIEAETPELPPAPEPVLGYAVAVDKASRKLYVLAEHDTYYEIFKTYEVSLGKIMGQKQQEGDLRTPEGLYRVVEIKEGGELPEIYGPRAFVLNYPNTYDQRSGRSGSGIWIHGSGLGERTPDTKGCMELDDDKVLALEEWIGIDSTIAIFPQKFTLPVDNGRIEKTYLTETFIYGNLLPVSVASASSS